MINESNIGAFMLVSISIFIIMLILLIVILYALITPLKENNKNKSTDKLLEENIMDKDNIKDWEDFRSSGLLWFINSILHLFGYAIVYTYDKGELLSVSPKRVSFRGFSEDCNTKGYKNITQYLKDNIDKLNLEVNE